jgi:hypothetical protein
MSFLLPMAVTLFVACAGITTAVLFRVAGSRPTLLRFLSSALASLSGGAAIASLTLVVLTRETCAGSESCGSDGFGFMEGGLMMAGLWLALYSLSYVVVGYLMAAHWRASPR